MGCPHLFAALLTALGIAACGPTPEEYNAKAMEADRLRRELAETGAARARLDAEIARLRAENRDLEQRLAGPADSGPESGP